MIAVRLLQQGRVFREQVFPSLPLHVGRDATNDVVLFDGSVSRRHARIERDQNGVLVVLDLDSRNGVHVGPIAVEHARGGSVVRCFVGRVALEVEALSDTPTLEIRVDEVLALEQRRTALDHVRYVLLGVLGCLVLVVSDSDFWSPWQKSRWGELVSSALFAATALPVLALVLLGMLRLVGRHVRIADTLRALAIVFVAVAALELLDHLLYYVLPVAAYSLFSALAGIAGAAATIVYLASLRKPRPRTRFQATWALISLMLLVGIGLTSHLEEVRKGTPQVDHEVQPPIAGFAGPGHSLEHHFAAVHREAETAARKATAVQAKHDRQRLTGPEAAPR